MQRNRYDQITSYSSLPENNEEEDGKDGDSGKSGDGESGGGPVLKPDIESLLDPSKGTSEGEAERAAKEQAIFGDWILLHEKMILWNSQKKRKLMLEQLDSFSKITKMLVVLGTQDGWDLENLMKALDSAANKKFGKNLYSMVSQLNDRTRMDWSDGRISPIESGRSAKI